MEDQASQNDHEGAMEQTENAEKKLAGEAEAERLEQRPSAATQEVNPLSADNNTELDDHYITPLQDGCCVTTPQRDGAEQDGYSAHHPRGTARSGMVTAPHYLRGTARSRTATAPHHQRNGEETDGYSTTPPQRDDAETRRLLRHPASEG